MRKNIKLIKHVPESTKNIHQEGKVPRLSTPLSVRNKNVQNFTQSESASIKKKIIKLTNQNNKSFDFVAQKHELQNPIKQCNFFEAKKTIPDTQLSYHATRILETPTLKPKQNPLKNYHPTQDSDPNSSRKFTNLNVYNNQQTNIPKESIQKPNNSMEQCTGELTFRSKQMLKPHQQTMKNCNKFQVNQNYHGNQTQPNISEFNASQTYRNKCEIFCHHHPNKMASYFIRQLNQTEIYICWSCAMKLSRQGFDIKPIKGKILHHTLIQLKNMNVMAPILEAKPSQQNNSFLTNNIQQQQYNHQQYESNHPNKRQQNSRQKGRQFNKQKSLIKIDKQSAKKTKIQQVLKIQTLRQRSNSIDEKNLMNNQINKFLMATSNYIMRIAHQYQKISKEQHQQDFDLEKQLEKLEEEKQQEMQAIRQKYNIKKKLLHKKFQQKQLQLQTEKNCLEVYLQRLLTAKQDVSMNKRSIQSGKIKKQQFQKIMMVYWDMIQDADKIQYTQRSIQKHSSSNKKSSVDTHDKKFNFTLSGKKNTNYPATKFSSRKQSGSKNSRQSTNSKAYPFTGVSFPILKMINSTTSEGNISMQESMNQSLVKEQYKF